MAVTPELRIALAMRGGVSLAVWMGGACSEIDALRCAAPLTDRPDRPLDADDPDASTSMSYARLLAACGYSGVAVDVVAGASAGGLNGALMGCSVVHGMPFGSNIRDLWLKLGDIATLARPWTLRPAPSVLDGDGRFYAPLFTRLRAFVATAPTPDRPVRLDLTLTGTLLHPRPTTRYQDLGAPFTEPRHRVQFRFRHLPVPDRQPVCDFGSAGQRDESLSRLAYAARATSSFPGAFEPASIGFSEPDPAPTGPPGQGLEPGAPPATLSGVYSESRDVGKDGVARDFVIDGGVLDNIPVAWAVRSIAAAPARRAVHRWLIYLQPVPFPELEEADEQRPGLRATVKKARRLRSGTETLSDDIDELERLKRSHLTHEGLRSAVEYALGEKRPAHQDLRGHQVAAQTDEEFLHELFARSLTAVGAYRESLGTIEASRLRQLWTDPRAVLGADPLGFAQFRWINREGTQRSDLLHQLRRRSAVPDAVLPAAAVPSPGTGGDAALAAQTRGLIEIGRQIRTPQALARTVAALLDSARDLGAPGMDLKQRIYDQRSRIELLIAWHDRLLAAEPFNLDPGEDATPVEAARRALRRLTTGSSQLGESGPVDTGWPETAFDGQWRALVELATELSATELSATELSATELSATPAPPQRAVRSCLASAASAASGEDRDARVEAFLVAMELLTGPARPDPLAETTPIRFHMLSAMNPSPLAVLRPDGTPLDVDDKLAGNQLSNFGAFLRARWRQNDWIWGRLDAARSLVDVLTLADAADETTGRQVDWDALAVLAGLPSGTPDRQVTDRLVEILHEQILREELPLLDILGGGPPSQAQLTSAGRHTGPLDDAAVRTLLATGKETLVSAIARDPRRLGIALRLGELWARGWTTGGIRAAARRTGDAIRRRRQAWVSQRRRQADSRRGGLDR